jgi:hypothetical protein
MLPEFRDSHIEIVDNAGDMIERVLRMRIDRRERAIPTH